jgi:hypothetical protein
MSSPSVAYSESVLSHLEKVQQLPVEVQVDIAKRIEGCIKIARASKNMIMNDKNSDQIADLILK